MVLIYGWKLPSIIASLKDLLEERENEAKESIDEFDNGENGSSDPKA